MNTKNDKSVLDKLLSSTARGLGHAVLLAFAGLCIFSCDFSGSPVSRGQGSIHIGPANGSSRTVSSNGTGGLPAIQRSVSPNGTGELAVMQYHCEVNGPGGKITRDFGPDGGTLDLSPGAYHIVVKAYNNDPRLRGITEQDITISAGERQTLMLTPVVGVRTDAEFADAISGVLVNSSTGASLTDTTHERNIIILENDIDLTTMLVVGSGLKITLIAEPGTRRTITRNAIPSNLGVAGGGGSGGVLQLGMAGETGALVLNGNGIDDPSASFMLVSTGASMIIDGNTEITGGVWSTNRGGAILVAGGSLEMRSGKIYGNTANYGGAVAVDSGTFTMKGGSIYGNTAAGTANIYGGGVSVEGATGAFIMEGGSIHGNTAQYGGAVAIDSGTFTMKGGSIDGNTATDASGQGGGGGVGVRTGFFTMTGGTISGNMASIGGGVHIHLVGAVTFAKRGGIIYGDSDNIYGNGNPTDNTATGGTTSGQAVHSEPGAKDLNSTIGSSTRLYVEAGPFYIDPYDGFDASGNW